ncbi:MAG: alpha/beta fold hydrolase [Spirochaetes bacterium]|nr:alpha/beta fold hydrolase [Spirochaetota bacterium]
MAIAAAIIAGTALILLACSWTAYDAMIRYRRMPVSWIVQTSMESGDLTPEMYALPWEREDIRTPGGYRIAGFFLPGSEPGLTAVFHHGIGWNRFGMFRYMEPFRKRGWNLACLDSRGHGDSGGGNPSFGVFEMRDLRLVVARAKERFPNTGALVLFGESMGAATVLQYAPLDPSVTAVIADCPFSSAVAELDHQLSLKRLPKPFRFCVVRIVDAMARFFDGFSLFDAAPERAIMETSVPILFIHGADDNYVPTAMSVRMHAARAAHAPTELAIFPEATHARSRHTDEARYDALVFDFISRARRGMPSATEKP